MRKRVCRSRVRPSPLEESYLPPHTLVRPSPGITAGSADSWSSFRLKSSSPSSCGRNAGPSPPPSLQPSHAGAQADAVPPAHQPPAEAEAAAATTAATCGAVSARRLPLPPWRNLTAQPRDACMWFQGIRPSPLRPAAQSCHSVLPASLSGNARSDPLRRSRAQGVPAGGAIRRGGSHRGGPR